MHEFDDTHTRSAPIEVYSDTLHVRNRAPWGLRPYPWSQDILVPQRVFEFLIGSGPDTDLQIRNPYVSAHHCVLSRRSDGGLTVTDKDSKNGTWLNGNRIQCADLPIGAMLTVGQARMIAIADPQQGARTALEQLVGEAPGFQAAVDMAIRAGRSDCPVLIVGETGTGKELFARLVHESSRRTLQPFIPLNCGAIPEQLVGSELFGHKRGAFTDAVQDREGVFVLADQGTLFLDEVGELPLTQQPHLLRVLEDQRVRRVGGDSYQQVDVRLVAATNRSDPFTGALPSLRQDLYHRLATVTVALPALRDRPEDIPLLIEAFLKDQAATCGERRVARLPMRELQRYPWPGNIRELRAAVSRALTSSRHVLRVEDFLPPSNRMLHEPEPQPAAVAAPPPPEAAPSQARPAPPPISRPGPARLGKCDEVVRDLIVDALEQYGSYRRAARALGISKSTLADRVQRYGIEWPRTDVQRPR